MLPEKKNIPVYRQFIQLIEKGFFLLNTETQNEIRQFVKDNQHAGGGFINRAGTPDLYYSLFGYLISSSLHLDDQLHLFKNYIENQRGRKELNSIDHLFLFLFEYDLRGKKPSFLSLLKVAFKKDQATQLSYRFFMFFMILDGTNQRKPFLKFILRLLLKNFRVRAKSPCSILSALIVVKHELRIDTYDLQLKLMQYFDEYSAFKAFHQTHTGELLSTAAALFALYKTGTDLRLYNAACLKFVQMNYANGAFLSGDGDDTRDLEYTFYGLLTLGILAGK